MKGAEERRLTSGLTGTEVHPSRQLSHCSAVVTSSLEQFAEVVREAKRLKRRTRPFGKVIVVTGGVAL